MLPTEEFSEIVARHLAVHNNYATNNQPIAPFLQVKYLRDATAGVEHIRTATDAYLTRFPAIADQSFTSMCDFITAQAPNFHTTANSMGYAGSARGSIQQHPDYARLVKSVTEDILKHQAMATVTTKPPALEKQRPAGQKRTARSYCFFHGYGTHTGDKCRTMDNFSGNFSAEQRKAKTHTETPGGSSAGI